MTADRLAAIKASIERCPPPYMTIYAIARGLGAIDEGAITDRPRDERNLGAAQFVALFGGSGELGATGTVH